MFHCLGKLATLTCNHLLHDLSNGMPSCGVCVEGTNEAMAHHHLEERGLHVSRNIGMIVYRHPIWPQLLVTIGGTMC